MKQRVHRFLFAVLIFTLCISTSFAQINRKEADAVDRFINAKMKESGLVGIGAAVIVNNQIVFARGYGYADAEKKIPFTTSTIMNAGSIAKSFLGVCILQLVEKNILSLDEDINTYLPFKVINPHYPDEKITLRNIATHSSGLADREPFYSDSIYLYNGEKPEPLGDFLYNYFTKGGKHYSDSNFYKAKPGEYWEYSNIAAALAGYIVELQSGKKLNLYCKENIFAKLGMKHSGWFLSEINRSKHAALYRYSGTTLNRIGLYESITYPDGGLRTTVSDLARFHIALLNGGVYGTRRILKKKSVDEMQRYQFTASRKPDNLDLKEKNEGLFWRTKKSGTLIGHGGTDPGVTTDMTSLLTKDVAVILFTNTNLSSRELGMAYNAIYNYLFEYGKQVRSKQVKK